MSTVSVSFDATDWPAFEIPEWPLPCRVSTAFVMGLIFAKNQFLDSTSWSPTDTFTSTWTTSNTFFTFPDQIKPFLTSPETLFEKIAQTRHMISDLKERWRLRLDTSMHSRGLNLIPYTSAGTYLLCDQNGDPICVVKPNDEDIFCIHDPHFPMPPLDGIRVRHEIPLYHAPEREVAAYQISYLLGMQLIPRTMMTIISSDKFYDVTDPFIDPKWQSWIYGLKAEERVQQLFDIGGTPDREKLCSIREYAPGTTLYDLQHRLSLEGRDQELPELVDFEDYEAANIITWLVGNTDAHAANILAYIKGKGPDGRERYGLKLIDFALSFPEKNVGLFNMLPELMLGDRKLSDYGKNLIASIPVEAIVQELKYYDLEACIPAFLERVQTLKTLTEMDLTFEEMNDKMCGIERSDELSFDHTFHFRVRA